jgi:DnaJ-class molecular chaperone
MTHEEQMRVCPECGGAGRCDYDVPVVDYMNGGFIDTVNDTCELCDGSGEVADNYGEEE